MLVRSTQLWYSVPDEDGNVQVHAGDHGTAAKGDGTLYLMETVMYMLVIMVQLLRRMVLCT